MLPVDGWFAWEVLWLLFKRIVIGGIRWVLFLYYLLREGLG